MAGKESRIHDDICLVALQAHRTLALIAPTEAVNDRGVPARRGAILSLAAGRRGLILTGSGSCVLWGRLPSSGWAAGVVTAKPITTHHQVCDYSRDQQRHGHGDAHSAPSRPPPSPPPRRIPWSIREINKLSSRFSLISAVEHPTINGGSRDRRYAPAFSIAPASRPSKVEPGSDHGSSQS